MDGSVSEFVPFPPGEHLAFAFSGIALMHRQLLVAVEEVSFGTLEKSNVWRSARVVVSHVFQGRCDRITTSFSPTLCSANDFRHPSCAYDLARIFGWPPCFGCFAFLSISFALENMICLSDACGPRLEFFTMTKPAIEGKSQLAFWVVARLRLYF